MPKNVIEYAFEGNVLDLEQAIKKVESLLRKSVKAMKTYQDGKLDVEQAAQVKSTRALLKQLRAQRDLKRAATADEIKRTNIAGKQALKNAASLHKKSLKIAKHGLAEQQKVAKQHEKSVSELISVAGQERATQQAFFLSSYADQLSGVIGADAFQEIQRAIGNFNAAKELFDGVLVTQEDLADAVSAVDDAYAKYASTLKHAKNAQQAANKGIHDLQSLMRSVEQQILLTVQSLTFWIDVLRRAVQLTREGIVLYSEYVESMNFLRRATDDAAESMENFTDKQVRAFGLDPTKINTAAATFYSFADSMGFTSKQSKLLATNMTKLSQDIASLQNIDVEDAASKLRSALAGQSKALATLGVNVNDANVEEWLLTKGLNKSMKQMNETSQAAARYAFILERTSAAHGDLAKTIGSPANQMKILSTQFQLLIQNLGAIGTVVLLPLVKLLNQVLLPFNAFVRSMTSLSASGFSSSVGEAGDEVGDLTQNLEAADEAAKGLTGIDEINQIENVETTSQQFGLDTDIEKLLVGYDNLATKSAALVPIFEALGKVAAPFWDMLGNETNINLFTGALEFVAMALWPIQKLLEGIGWLVNKLPKPIRNVVGLVSEAVITFMSLATILSAIKVLMSSKIFTTFATTFMSITKAIFGAVGAATKWLATSAKLVAQAIAQGIKNLWEAGTWWTKAAAVVAAAGVGAVAVAAVAGAGVAAVAAMQSNSMPQLANGAVAVGPTFAMIGEGAYNEAVIPLGNSPQFKEMKQDIASEVAKRNPTRAATPVILNVNGRELARALLPDLEHTQPQTGVKLKR